ncbi:MAG: PleD family two-component system response regulator [Fibrobacterota bacterium]
MQKKILIVDDSAPFRRVLSVSLQKNGFEVIEAEDGRDALKKASSEMPDLIVMDLMMPVYDGLEATRSIKANTNLKDIPIIILSSRDEPHHRKNASLAGTDNFLIKPVKTEELISEIKKLTTSI